MMTLRKLFYDGWYSVQAIFWGLRFKAPRHGMQWCSFQDFQLLLFLWSFPMVLLKYSIFFSFCFLQFGLFSLTSVPVSFCAIFFFKFFFLWGLFLWEMGSVMSIIMLAKGSLPHGMVVCSFQIIINMKDEKCHRCFNMSLMVAVVTAGFGLCTALFIGVIAYFPEKPKKPPSLTSFIHEQPSAFSEDIKRLLR